MRLGAKRSVVWNYFKKNENGKSTSCLLCKKIIQYYGGTSNLRQHLLRIHPGQINQRLSLDDSGNKNEDGIFLQENQSAVNGSSSNNEPSELKTIQPRVQNQEFLEYSQGIQIQSKNNLGNIEVIRFAEDPLKNAVTIWTRQETLALIYVYSQIKEKFRNFNTNCHWSVTSDELSKLGIQKAPKNCELKWNNLLRVYRQHKQGNKGAGKFEFFNELDDIISSDPQFRYTFANTNNITEFSGEEIFEVEEEQMGNKKRKCSCLKSEKQKRHEDRMALMTKKVEIEERKVKAFEDYLVFIKRNADCADDS